MTGLKNRSDMKRIYCILLVTMMTVSGCGGKATVSKSRGWLESDRDYPASKYLTTTGIGQSEAEARRQAKVELSNIFESKVSGDTLSRMKSVVDETGDEKLTDYFEQNIRIISAIEIKGVQIGKSWYDKKQGVYYVLAVLNRKEAKDEWQGQADDIDNRITAIMRSLDSMESDLRRLQSMKKARKLWVEREVIASRLRVLGFKSTSRSSYNIIKILNDIEKVRADMHVLLEVGGGEYSETVRDAIAEVLGSLGYALAKPGNSGNVTVKVSVDVHPVMLDNPDWKFARATVSLSIIDRATNVAAGEVTENKRASHLTYQEAARKAVRQVLRPVGERLMEYFGNRE